MIDSWGIPLSESAKDEFEKLAKKVKLGGFKQFFQKNKADVGVNMFVPKVTNKNDVHDWLHGFSDFRNRDDYKIKGMLDTATFTNDGIEIYRSIRVPDYVDTHYTLDFFQNLLDGKFVVGKKEFDGAGVAWAYDPKNSHVYWSDNGTVVKMKAVAPISSIDIDATVYLNMMNTKEHEIRLKQGSPLTLLWANAATYRGKDQKKVSELSKQVRGIHVTA